MRVFIYAGFCSCQEDTTTKIFRIQASEKPNKLSYALWDNVITRDLNALTICYRIKIFFYRPEVTVFSFIGKEKMKIRTGNMIDCF